MVAYSGARSNQKWCPMVHWIIGKLYAKYKGGLNSRDDKGLNKPFKFFSKHAYKDGYCGL